MVHTDTPSLTIVGIGELLWDIFPDGRQLGGAPANVVYHCAAMGASGKIVSSVGRDTLGDEILERLKNHQLSTEYIAIDDQHPTGTVTIELDDHGKPTFTIHEDVAWDFIPSRAPYVKLAEECDAICFGSLAQRSPVSRETIQTFLETCKPHALRIFDINLRQHYYSKEIIQQSLDKADVLKINDEEYPKVAAMLDISGSEDDILNQLIETYNLDVIAVTKGKEGSILKSKNGSSVHPGIKPESVADTVGAGDSFTAALIMGLLQDVSLDTINEQANKLASYVCTQMGAMPPIPDAMIQLK